MYFAPKEIQLKDGRTAILRSPLPSDAEEMLASMKTTAAETDFLLRTPAEVTLPVEGEARYLNWIAQDPNSLMLLCFVDGALAGNCNISRRNKLKNRHRADIGIALEKKFWGLGIGTAMFHEMIDQAKQWDLYQVELEVFEGNTRGIALYHKMGFEIVSNVPNAILLPDGTFWKEYKMVKVLKK